MAFLNSAALLNRAADVMKPAPASQVSQNTQSNTAEEFAQTLRKQLQQSGKSANTMAAPEDSKTKPPVKETLHERSAEAATKNIQNEAKDQGKPNTAKDKSKEDTQADRQASEEVAAGADAPSGLDETALDRKKRLINTLEATDPAAAGMTPWMQTMTEMIAMRQASAQAAEGETGSVTGAEGIPLPKGEFVAGPVATVLQEEALANQAITANTTVPVAAQVTGDQPTVTTDTKTPLSSDSQLAQVEQPASFSETLGIAKSVADAVREAISSDKVAGQAMEADVQGQTSAAVTLPAAQALPNSPWLNTAGVAQNANVILSQVATPFGNERWQTAMNQHVMNMVGSGDEVASLTLSPPDLGPIQVVLKVDNQSVNTSFITDNPLVRQALEDGMQDLRERMQSQGLQLGQTFVGDGQQAQQHFEQQPTRQSAGLNASEAEANSTTQAAVQPQVARGLVDTFV